MRNGKPPTTSINQVLGPYPSFLRFWLLEITGLVDELQVSLIQLRVKNLAVPASGVWLISLSVLSVKLGQKQPEHHTHIQASRLKRYTCKRQETYTSTNPVKSNSFHVILPELLATAMMCMS